jgi:hypothetical protein
MPVLASYLMRTALPSPNARKDLLASIEWRKNSKAEELSEKLHQRLEILDRLSRRPGVNAESLQTYIERVSAEASAIPSINRLSEEKAKIATKEIEQRIERARERQAYELETSAERAQSAKEVRALEERASALYEHHLQGLLSEKQLRLAENKPELLGELTRGWHYADVEHAARLLSVRAGIRARKQGLRAAERKRKLESIASTAKRAAIKAAAMITLPTALMFSSFSPYSHNERAVEIANAPTLPVQYVSKTEEQLQREFELQRVSENKQALLQGTLDSSPSCERPLVLTSMPDAYRRLPAGINATATHPSSMDFRARTGEAICAPAHAYVQSVSEDEVVLKTLNGETLQFLHINASVQPQSVVLSGDTIGAAQRLAMRVGQQTLERSHGHMYRENAQGQRRTPYCALNKELRAELTANIELYLAGETPVGGLPWYRLPSGLDQEKPIAAQLEERCENEAQYDALQKVLGEAPAELLAHQTPPPPKWYAPTVASAPKARAEPVQVQEPEPLGVPVSEAFLSH